MILLVLIVGVTYAAFNYSFLGGQSSITTGTVELKLLESNSEVISITNMFPMSDKEGINQEETFDFAVITKANYEISIGYDLYVEKLEVDTGYTSLNNSDIKIYLTDYNNNKLIDPVNIGDLSGNTFYTKVNEHTKTTTEITNKYKLRAWIDKDVDASNWNENTKLEYKFKLGVSGGERKLIGATKQIANMAVMDNTSSTYVTASTGIDFTEAPSNTNGKGVYQRAGSENEGTYPVYYYRGEVNDNNVIYGGYCWKIVRTTSTGGIKLVYNGLPSSGTCTGTDPTIGDSMFNNPEEMTNTANTQESIQPSTLEQTQNKEVKQKKLAVSSEEPVVTLTKINYSPADVGYMYGKRYLTYEINLKNNTDTIVYGNDVTYENGEYTLKDTITSTSYDTDYKTIGQNHHYTCLNASNKCSSVYYINLTNKGQVFVLKLDDGNNIDEALKEMLTESTNTKDSEIKQTIDGWYSTNTFTSSDKSLLEDTIWCNDRSIYNKGGFDKDTNADFSNATNDLELYERILLFKMWNLQNMFSSTANQTINPSLKCTSNNDSFTVSTENGNGKLTYPVGLLTVEEATIAGHGIQGYSASSYLHTGSYYWLSSPFGFNYGFAFVSDVHSDGFLDAYFVDYSIGVRPSVSLKLGTEFVNGGAGTSDNPYVVNVTQ